MCVRIEPVSVHVCMCVCVHACMFFIFGLHFPRSFRTIDLGFKGSLVLPSSGKCSVHIILFILYPLNGRANEPSEA